MRGIILAGGSGTRLHPITYGVSKQLLPVYDKPMVYYPMSVLMLAKIRDVLIISTPVDLPMFERLFGDGSQFGMNISYAVQQEPKGLAEAFVIGADFVGSDESCLVLGDNIFFGNGFTHTLGSARAKLDGCVLFGTDTKTPERYGVAEFDADHTLIGIQEKPKKPKSHTAITGLYMFDNNVVEIARNLQPSARGELEITDVNNIYIEQRRASLVHLGRGFTWLDAGTHDSLLESAELMHAIYHRQGQRIACLEEIALRIGNITVDDCLRIGASMGNSEYGKYLTEFAERWPE